MDDGSATAQRRRGHRKTLTCFPAEVWKLGQQGRRFQLVRVMRKEVRVTLCLLGHTRAPCLWGQRLDWFGLDGR